MGTHSPPWLVAVPAENAANTSGPPRDVQGDVLAGAPDNVSSIDPVRRLVERARDGDKDAFGQVFRLHHDAIFRYARLHVGAEAEDVVAEIFTRAWVQLPGYRYAGVPFVAWLHGIARYVVADELQRRERMEHRPTLPETLATWAEDDRLQLSQAIGRLPDEHGRVIELKYLMGMRQPEVAEALDTTANAVNATQWRALSALRNELEDDA